MRKRLLGTTTLATLGILAYGVTGGDANAAEPISIEAGGFFGSVMTLRDQSDNAGLREFNVDTSGEIQFRGSATLDNGLAVGVRIEYEAHNQGGGGSIVDERYLTLDGGFGQLKFGSDDSAAYSMHYQAPVAAWQVGLNSPSYAGLAGAGNLASSYLSTYPWVGGDGNKIIYFSPRFGGIQLGASYQPDAAVTEGPSFTGTNDTMLGQQSDIWTIGGNYNGSFDGVDVSASLGYTHSAPETDTAPGASMPTSDDREAWAAGLNFAWDAFAIGAAYKIDNNGVADGMTGDTTVLDLGFTYTTGPWVLGFNYGHLEQEVPAGVSGPNTGEDGLDGYAFTANYSMGPGINLIAALKYYEYDSSFLATATPDGGVVALGVVVGF